MNRPTDQMHCYRAFGLNIHSEIALPDYQPGTNDAADLTIRLGAEAEAAWKRHQANPAGRWFDGACVVDPEEAVLGIRDVGRYVARRGREIILSPDPDASPAAVRLFLIGSATGLILHQRNMIAMHGAGIVTPQGLTVLTGDSGAGKSTAAAHLARRGVPIMADDTLPLDRGADGIWFARPGATTFKIWEDALAQLDRSPHDLTAVANRLEKFYVDNPSIAPDHPVPLREVILLDKGDETGMQTITGLDAVRLVADNTYRPEYVPLFQREAAFFKQVNALCEQIDVRRFRRPWDPDRIGESIDHLLRHWGMS